jgi:DNA-binding response OmpR family regulator
MKKHTVLVVEDDPKSMRVLDMYLSECYQVIKTENAEQALEVLKKMELSGTDPIAVIVLDWMMPGISGIELLKMLKSNYRFRNIPVIMQTAKIDSRDIADGLKKGAFQYLTKPYDGEVLMAMVSSAVIEFEKLQQEKAEIREYRKLTRKQFKRQSLDLKVLQVLNDFSLKSFADACSDPVALVQLVFEALKQFRFDTAAAKEAAPEGEKDLLRCSILIRKGSANEISYSDRGYAEALSVADRYLMGQAVDASEILTRNNFTAIPSNSGNVAFLIRNSPVDPEEKERAIRIVVNIIEYFEIRLEHFENQLKIKSQKDNLEKSQERTQALIQTSLNEFEEVNLKYQQVKDQQMTIWEQLVADIAESDPLQAKVTTAMNEALRLYGEDHLTDQRFLGVMTQLGELFGRRPTSDEAVAEQLGGTSQADIDALFASLKDS